VPRTGRRPWDDEAFAPRTPALSRGGRPRPRGEGRVARGSWWTVRPSPFSTIFSRSFSGALRTGCDPRDPTGTETPRQVGGQFLRNPRQVEVMPVRHRGVQHLSQQLMDDILALGGDVERGLMGGPPISSRKPSTLALWFCCKHPGMNGKPSCPPSAGGGDGAHRIRRHGGWPPSDGQRAPRPRNAPRRGARKRSADGARTRSAGYIRGRAPSLA